MGISIFPSKGDGYTLQRVITTTGEYSLGQPTFAYVMMSGGGGGGARGWTENSVSGGGGGGAGAFGISMLINQFHATIGAGGTGGSGGTISGTDGGNSAFTFGHKHQYTNTTGGDGANRPSKQIVAMGGGAGGVNTSSGAGKATANVSVTGRSGSTWFLGSGGSSGGGVGGATSGNAYQTIANSSSFYSVQNFVHNGHGNFTETNANPTTPTDTQFSQIAPAPTNSYNTQPTNVLSATYAIARSNLSTSTTSTIGVAAGGRGVSNAAGDAFHGSGGVFTGGGGGGSWNGISGSGGGSAIYNGGLGSSTAGHGGGGGAGIFGAGADNSTVNAGAGGLGGGGGGGGGAGGTNGNGGNGGAGILLIFF